VSRDFELGTNVSCKRVNHQSRTGVMYLMNADGEVATNYRNKSTDIHCESASRLLSSTPTVTIYN